MGSVERSMRIMLSADDQLSIARGQKLVRVTSIPWGMFDEIVAPRQAQANHQQSLETLSSRGGLSACEAIAIIAGTKWRRMDSETAHRILYAMRALYRRTPTPPPASEGERHGQ